MFVWVNIAFKRLRLYHDGACWEQWYFDQCAATQECHAGDSGHDTYHSIHTWGQPVVVLSIVVERHTGIHNYPMICLTRSGNPSLTFYTHQRMLNFMMLLYMVVISQKPGRKCTMPSLELGICGMRIHSYFMLIKVGHCVIKERQHFSFKRTHFQKEFKSITLKQGIIKAKAMEKIVKTLFELASSILEIYLF